MSITLRRAQHNNVTHLTLTVQGVKPLNPTLLYHPCRKSDLSNGWPLLRLFIPSRWLISVDSPDLHRGEPIRILALGHSRNLYRESTRTLVCGGLEGHDGFHFLFLALAFYCEALACNMVMWVVRVEDLNGRRARDCAGVRAYFLSMACSWTVSLWVHFVVDGWSVRFNIFVVKETVGILYICLISLICFLVPPQVLTESSCLSQQLTRWK
jgi:hypothetical protein